MSPRAVFWILIGALALGTWSMRSLPIMAHGRIPNPPWLERLLRHVPVAALTALVIPGSLYVKAHDVYSPAPARTIAAVAALLVALRTRNTALTLAVGMGVLWIGQWVLGAL